MIKRLSISVMLLAMAAFALTGAATAFWSTSESASVAISTGTADLGVEVRVDCAGPWTDAGDNPELSWSSVYPGLTTSDCFRVTNTGDAPLAVELRFQGFSGSNVLNDLRFRYRDDISDATLGGSAAAPNSSLWTEGIEVGTLEAGQSETFRVNAEMLNTSSNQNNLQDSEAGFTAIIEGITP